VEMHPSRPSHSSGPMASAIPSAIPSARTYLDRLDSADHFGIAAGVPRVIPTQALSPWAFFGGQSASCANAERLPHACMARVTNRNTPLVNALPHAPPRARLAGSGCAVAPRVKNQGAAWGSSIPRAPTPALTSTSTPPPAASALARAGAERAVAPQRQKTFPSGGDKESKPSTEALQLLHVPGPHGNGDDECRVRLMLTVSSGGVGFSPPGSVASDCGECQYCLDKPKFGGPGSKRKRCLARCCLEPPGPARVWGSLRVVTVQYLRELEAYASQDPPPELVEARAHGPIPLVWGLRRAPRARPLPPAYVLMYHCERHVQLDLSTLPLSLTQQWQGKGGRRGPRGQEADGGIAQDDESGGGADRARHPLTPDSGMGGMGADAAAEGESVVASDDEMSSESEAGRHAEGDGAMDLDSGRGAAPDPQSETELRVSGARTSARRACFPSPPPLPLTCMACVTDSALPAL
jgi:hypothetical protein